MAVEPTEPMSLRVLSSGQARRPVKLKVFVSYSREDVGFADQLASGLRLCGFEPFVDRHSVASGEAWQQRLGQLIRDADTVVFVLTPASASSPVCAWEVAEAQRLNKRILPVLCRPLDGALPPQPLSDLSYIFFYAEPSVPGAGFGQGLTELVAALNSMRAWPSAFCVCVTIMPGRMAATVRPAQGRVVTGRAGRWWGGEDYGTGCGMAAWEGRDGRGAAGCRFFRSRSRRGGPSLRARKRALRDGAGAGNGISVGRFFY